MLFPQPPSHTFLRSALPRFAARSLAVFLLLFACLPATAQQKYSINVIGVPGTTISEINSSGHVVGQTFFDNGPAKAFLWDKNSGMRNLGSLTFNGNVAFSFAYGISDNDLVVGRTGVHAFLWDNVNGMRDIGLNYINFGCNPGAIFPQSIAYGVNNDGQIVGESNYCRPNGGGTLIGNTGAIWNGVSSPSELSPSGFAPGGFPYRINNGGQVLRTIYVGSPSTGLYPHAMFNGIDLGTLTGNPNTQSLANGFNENGQVVGSSESSTGFHHAFLWQSPTACVIWVRLETRIELRRLMISTTMVW